MTKGLTDCCLALHCVHKHFDWCIIVISSWTLIGIFAPFWQICDICAVVLPSLLWRCWLGSRKGIQPVKICGEVLAWLSIWGNVQICIWFSWCHCHSLSLAPVNLVLAHPGSPIQRAVKQVLLFYAVVRLGLHFYALWTLCCFVEWPRKFIPLKQILIITYN